MNANVIEARSHQKLDEKTRNNLRRFARGEVTWAEVEGVTYQQAQQIAQIGCELAANGRLQDACVVFEGLVAINPKDTAGHAALGTIYQRLNRTDEAMAHFDQALELFDGNVVALANRGELRLRNADPRGLEDLARAVNLDPDASFAATRRAKLVLSALAASRQAQECPAV